MNPSTTPTRQLTSPNGTITHAQTYDPYGVVTQTAGPSQTDYGYTSEFTANDMVYLRARQYAPSMGRFLTRDTWEGNITYPLSLNRWNYVSGNSINRTDPSGLCWYPDLQTGGTLIDRLTPNPNLCPWFIEGVKQMGWNIPYDARPDNWISYIPEGKREQFLSPNPNLAFIGLTTNESKPLWQIIYYGKSPKHSGYQEVQPFHKDIGGTIFVAGAPVVIETGVTSGFRSDNTGVYNVNSVFVHGGPGVDIFGVAQVHGGIQTGNSTGLYLETELFGSDCGIKIALPDTEVYFPGGAIGVTNEMYKSHWILTTQKAVRDSGGYKLFGEQYAFVEGFDSYYILIEGTDKKALQYWWFDHMSHRYTLKERP